jgi:hypothetical protein
MNTTDLANVANYGLTVNGTPTALPSGSTVEVVSSTKVKITLGSTGAPAPGTTVAVQVNGNVKDAAGNAIGGLYGTSTNTVTYGTASTFTITPAAGSLKLVAADKLQFELNTELSAVDASKFTFNDGTDGDNTGITVAGVTYVNNAGKSTVTVQLSGALDNTDVTTANIQDLTIADGGLTNAEGLALTGGPVVFDTASGKLADKVAAKIESVETTAANQITVTFSEAIPAGEISNATFSVAGNTVASVAHTPGTDTVVITLGSNIDTDATPKVTQNIDIKDVAGNVLAAGTSVVDTADKLAPVVVSSSIVNATTVDITFSELVDETSAEAAAYTITTADGTDTETLTSATLLADGKTVRLVFSGANIASNDSVTVPATVKDAKNNTVAAPIPVTLP